MGLRRLKTELERRSRGEPIVDIRLEPGDKWPVSRVCDVTFIDCDFRFVQLGGLLSRPCFQRCVFQNVRLDGGKWTKSSFERCQFLDSHVGRDAYSHWLKCRFVDCSWAGGALKVANLDDCQFKGCRFDEASWEDVTLLRCGLDGVTLSGHLRTVLFDRCALEDLDLGGAQYRELTFLDSTVGTGLRMPLDPSNVVFRTSEDLDRWLMAVRSELGTDAAAQLDTDLEFIRKTGRPICIDPDSFEEVAPERRLSVIAVGKKALEQQG